MNTIDEKFHEVDLALRTLAKHFEVELVVAMRVGEHTAATHCLAVDDDSELTLDDLKVTADACLDAGMELMSYGLSIQRSEGHVEKLITRPEN